MRMATYMRVQISAWASTDPTKDRITNTLHFKSDMSPDNVFTGEDYEQIGIDVRNAWAVGQPVYCRGVDRVEVKVYNLEDPQPRMPRAAVTGNVTMTNHGVREVCLCLSFSDGTNSRRKRGRIYMGPFAPDQLHEVPGTTIRSAVHTLADRMAGIGGINVDWCVFSPTEFAASQQLGAAMVPVQKSWVDDAWDTQRRRGIPPSTRLEKSHGE